MGPLGSLLKCEACGTRQDVAGTTSPTEYAKALALAIVNDDWSTTVVEDGRTVYICSACSAKMTPVDDDL